jgi:hypothetical protein
MAKRRKKRSSTKRKCNKCPAGSKLLTGKKGRSVCVGVVSIWSSKLGVYLRMPRFKKKVCR